MATHVDVYRRVGLGELRWSRDALITERRRWRPGDHWPGHVGAIILLNDKNKNQENKLIINRLIETCDLP